MELYLQAFAAQAESAAEAPAGGDETGSGAPENGAVEIEETAGEEPAPAEETPAEETPAEETPAEGEAAAPDAGERERLLNSAAAAVEAAARQAEVRAVVAGWRQEAAALREIYPGFDLERQSRENGEFARLLKAGVSVRRAFEAANLEAILGEAMRYAARTAGKKTAQTLASSTGRVTENGVLDRAASLSRRDVESLSKADILHILDEVSRGAKITF